MTKLQEKSPLIILTYWSLNIVRDLEPQGQKRSGITNSDMASEKSMRMEEIEKGQQDMQEKISQATEMVTSLTKGNGIIEDPSSRDRPTSWKNNDSKFAVPNLNDLCEQEKLKKNMFGRLEHINVQQRCNLLDKRLKVMRVWMISKVWTLKSYAWSLTCSYCPISKCQHLKGTMEPNALRTIWPRIVTRWLDMPIMRIC